MDVQSNLAKSQFMIMGCVKFRFRSLLEFNHFPGVEVIPNVAPRSTDELLKDTFRMNRISSKGESELKPRFNLFVHARSAYDCCFAQRQKFKLKVN